MATGIILPSLLSISTSEAETVIISSLNQPQQVDLQTNGPWTPPQFSQPALTILQVNYPPYSLSPKQASTASIDYVFDAVLRLLHKRVMRKTVHPVLTGAAISDHAYIEPTRVSLEIGMSDSMSSYSSDIWSGSATKSISAWQKIKGFQINRNLITLVTRLDTYSNMMIIEAEAPDDYRTKHGLRATIVLEELLSASVLSIPASSARPDTTDTTSQGTVQGTSPSVSQVEQHALPSHLADILKPVPIPQFAPLPVLPFTPAVSVPGAGVFSSTTLDRCPPGVWKP